MRADESADAFEVFVLRRRAGAFRRTSGANNARSAQTRNLGKRVQFDLPAKPGKLRTGNNRQDFRVGKNCRDDGFEKEVLQKILEIRKPLPILRCETAKEAEILQKHLRDSGLHTLIISDEKLAPENPPKRLRAMHFREGYIILTIFNTNETLAVRVEDLNLIVSGSIFEKTIESTEARKKGESKILNATETASDESLVDIYAETDANGYRILTKGFDFSCLGAEKGILARENIKGLERKLQSAAPQARPVDDYLSVRNLLGEIWEIEQRRDSQGLTRQRFGKFDLSSVSSSSNLQQFTKYSRLHWQLLSEGS
jgi:hypothetical protein